MEGKKARRHMAHNEGGFTLVELLVVVAIAGILVIAFGVSFDSWRDKYIVESDIKEIHTLLMDAKYTATKEKSYVFINAPAGDAYSLISYVDKKTLAYPFGNGKVETNFDRELRRVSLRNKLDISPSYRHFWFDPNGNLGHARYNDIDDGNYRDFQIRLLQQGSDTISAQADYNCMLIEPPLYFNGGIWNATEAEENSDISFRNLLVSANETKFGEPLCKVK